MRASEAGGPLHALEHGQHRIGRGIDALELDHTPYSVPRDTAALGYEQRAGLLLVIKRQRSGAEQKNRLL